MLDKLLVHCVTAMMSTDTDVTPPICTQGQGMWRGVPHSRTRQLYTSQ